MNKTKEILVTSFALFSLFFGAGNLLIPPHLGYNSGNNWFLVTIGFLITAVIIPILGIFAHAKLQGGMFNFAKKVSPLFSNTYCILVFIISIAIPSPRTASATHELAIHPLFETPALLTSSIYFLLVLIFVLNRSKILNVIGKFLTPFIVLILFAVIGISLLTSPLNAPEVTSKTPTLFKGIIEGYQTFDAIGAVVVGAVIIVSLNYQGNSSFENKKALIRKSGLIAGIGLFIIYTGLISIGTFYRSEIDINLNLDSDIQRATLLREITSSALGSFGNTFLSILISLACFTTAIGIIAGAADYFKSLFFKFRNAYTITAIIACLIGIIIGQLNFNSIITLAFPILLFIYPITIALILLNVIPNAYAPPITFKIVIAITFVFSIPDVLNFICPSDHITNIIDIIPLGQYSLAWVLPALISFIMLNFKKITTKSSSN